MPITSPVNRCPACEYLVPPAWDMCKRCGAALKAPVGAGVAAAPVHAYAHSQPGPAPGAPIYTDGDLLPGRGGQITPPPVPASTDFDLLPMGAPRHTASPRAARADRSTPRLSSGTVMTVLAVVALGIGGWMFWPSGSDTAGDTAADADMEILPSIADGQTDPPGAAYQVEAEAQARQASMMVVQAYAEMGDPSAVTLAFMAQYDPSLQYVDGAQPSTDSQVVSMRSTATDATLAVAGQGDVCAFARVDAQMNIGFVSAKTSSCSADNAPGEGWSGTGAVTGGGGLGGTGLDPGLIEEPITDPNLVTS